MAHGRTQLFFFLLRTYLFVKQEPSTCITAFDVKFSDAKKKNHKKKSEDEDTWKVQEGSRRTGKKVRIAAMSELQSCKVSYAENGRWVPLWCKASANMYRSEGRRAIRLDTYSSRYGSFSWQNIYLINTLIQHMCMACLVLGYRYTRKGGNWMYVCIGWDDIKLQRYAHVQRWLFINK